MDKDKFKIWALTRPSFTDWNGTLMYFRFDFWELVPEVQKHVLDEYEGT
jgi:hypothetical protein